ncbi:MAG: plasmid mobilization protein [Propylenella sp.]
MAESGSENRQRKVKRTVRFTTIEDALLCSHAGVAGLTVASYIRQAALDMPPPRGVHCPSIDRHLTAQLIAAMGEAATAFRNAAELADPALVESAINDFSEYRIVLFESMGRAP